MLETIQFRSLFSISYLNTEVTLLPLLWVRNLISHPTRRQSWEQGAEQNTWNQDEEVTGEWKILHNKNLHLVSYAIVTIESKKIKRAAYVAPLGEIRNAHNIVVGNPEEKDHLGDSGIDSIILKWVFKTQSVTEWDGFIWLRIKSSDGLL